METITREYKIYSFDELSEAAQQKAIENNYDINVNYEWYEYTIDEIKAEADKAGMTFEKLYFDLDRGSYLYMHQPQVTDESAMLKAAKVDRRTKAARYVLDYHGINIYTHHHGGGSAHNTIDADELSDRLTAWLNDLQEEWRIRLSKEYDYLTSREAIQETLEINEYKYTEDGEIFN